MSELNLEEELSPETLAYLKEFIQDQQSKVINHNDEDWEFVLFLDILNIYTFLMLLFFCYYFRLAQFWV